MLVVKSIKTGKETTMTEKEYSALVEHVDPNKTKFVVTNNDSTPPEAKAVREATKTASAPADSKSPVKGSEK